MALLTVLAFEDAASLLDGYGLELLDLTPLQAGSVNSNFFLEARTPKGNARSLFARIYEEQGADGASFELLVNEALDRAGIPVARPVRLSDGSLFVEHRGKPFALYERLRGEVMCQKRVTPAMAQSVGEALARVHVAPLGELRVGKGRFDFLALRARLEVVQHSGRGDLLPAVERLLKLASELEKERSSNLPQGLIHGDLFRDNVLMRESHVVGLLDFESASHGPFAFDLMVTILAWCFGSGLDPRLTRSLVEGYLRVRSLEKVEQEALVVEGSVACVRFATTRLTDFSLRVAEGEAPVRDYRRFFDRLDALLSGEFMAALSGLFP